MQPPTQLYDANEVEMTSSMNDLIESKDVFSSKSYGPYNHEPLQDTNKRGDSC